MDTNVKRIPAFPPLTHDRACEYPAWRTIPHVDLDIVPSFIERLFHLDDLREMR